MCLNNRYGVVCRTSINMGKKNGDFQEQNMHSSNEMSKHGSNTEAVASGFLRLHQQTINLFRSWCLGSEYGQYGQPSSLIPQTLLLTLSLPFLFLCVGCSVLLALLQCLLHWLAPFGKLFVFSLDCSSAGGRRRRISFFGLVFVRHLPVQKLVRNSSAFPRPYLYLFAF